MRPIHGAIIRYQARKARVYACGTRIGAASCHDRHLIPVEQRPGVAQIQQQGAARRQRQADLLPVLAVAARHGTDAQVEKAFRLDLHRWRDQQLERQPRYGGHAPVATSSSMLRITSFAKRSTPVGRRPR